jgi:DNA-binding NtrC family response regulator
MRPVPDIMGRVGPSDANILITGEPGTGKEVVARTLHVLSNRASKPMVTIARSVQWARPAGSLVTELSPT